MKRLILSWAVLLCCLTITSSFAQTRNCGADDHMQMLQQQYPDMLKNQRAIEDFTQQYIATHSQNSRTASVNIPVVVHVVYRKNNENISDAQVQSQIDVLNEDFRRLNADASNTPSQYLSVAADTDIEFCLASVDPNGNPTSGITRTSTRKRSFSYNNDGIKFNSSGGKDAWPRGQYLNIWVGNLGNNLLGYAQFPGGPANTDGVVVLYYAFGTTGNVSSPFHLGRTATHEVGHWLNLRHIWGDGGCGVDDFVGDTPESDASNYGCALGHVSCGTRDMVENYMDYSDDACMNIYTVGQSARMNAMFASGGFRESLLYSGGCGGSTPPPPPPTGCDVPTGLSATAITETQATLNWSAVSGASTYNVRARQVGAATWATANTAATSINFTGLLSCTDYEFQVEAVCSGSTSGFSASSNFTSSGCGPAPCDVPSGLAASSITDVDALLTWSTVSGAVSYNVQARQTGTSTWASGNTTGTSISYTGLNGCTEYEFQVEAVCDASASGYSTSETFTTTGCTPPPPPTSCDAPTGLFVSGVSNKSATVNWSAVAGASSYEVQYREAGKNWRNKSTSSTSVKLGGLKRNKTYEWHVRAICGTTNSAYSTLESFVGGVGRFASDATEFMIYPNPANNIVTVQLPGEEVYSIRLFDLTGKLLNQVEVDGYDFGSHDISVIDLPAGIYYIQLEGESVGSTKKLVVTH